MGRWVDGYVVAIDRAEDCRLPWSLRENSFFCQSEEPQATRNLAVR
jgi:hypothetical protein